MAVMAAREEMVGLLVMAASEEPAAMAWLARMGLLEQMARLAAWAAMAGPEVAGDPSQAMAAREEMPVKVERAAQAATEWLVLTVSIHRAHHLL
jgi:hypothetical protein